MVTVLVAVHCMNSNRQWMKGRSVDALWKLAAVEKASRIREQDMHGPSNSHKVVLLLTKRRKRRPSEVGN